MSLGIFHRRSNLVFKLRKRNGSISNKLSDQMYDIFLARGLDVSN